MLTPLIPTTSEGSYSSEDFDRATRGWVIVPYLVQGGEQVTTANGRLQESLLARPTAEDDRRRSS